MNLLAPAFLAGLALIAAPIIAHLIRRSTRDRFAFSSLRFLDESPPRLERRSRIQHPWLLLLRALAVAVLAFAFARPYWSGNDSPAAAPGMVRHIVILVDTSASMRREGIWNAAIARANDIVKSAGPADQLALAAMSVDTRWLVSAEHWRATPPDERQALAAAALASLAPGWRSTHLDAAAESAVLEWERMTEADGAAGQRELVIVSDFAAGTRTAGLAEIDWPPGSRVHLSRVDTANTGNTSIEWLGWTTAMIDRSTNAEQPAPSDAPAQVATPNLPTEVPAARLRISRSFDAPGELDWTATDPITGDILDLLPELDLLPGGTRVFTVPWSENAPDAVRIDLITEDAADFDNRLWIARSPVRHVRLVYLGEHDTSDPTHSGFYLARAAGGIREPAVEFEITRSPAPGGSGVWVIDGPPPSGTVDASRRHIEAGGTVLWLNPASADGGASLSTLERLSGIGGWQPLSSARTDALFGQVDFQHPLFAPFADPRFSDFTRIRTWNPRPIQPPDTSNIRVVARFDDATPAVLEQTIGQGQLVLWCSGWAPADGQWVLSSKFVPWLFAMMERAAGGSRLPATADVDNPSRLLADGTAGTGWQAIEAAADPGDHPPLLVPGIYVRNTNIERQAGVAAARHRDTGSRTETRPRTPRPVPDPMFVLRTSETAPQNVRNTNNERRLVALNVPAAESRFETLPLDTWERLGVPLAGDAGAAGRASEAALSMEARAVEGRQQLWRGLLWAAVVILAIESLVSIRLSRGAQPVKASAAN